MADILDLKHASRILLFLLEKGQIKKTDLLEVISSSDSLSHSLREMEEEGLINVATKVIGRKIIFIGLTPKGCLVAEELKKAEQIANSQTIEINDIDEPDLMITNEKEEMVKRLNLLFHINVVNDHITVEEVKPGKSPRIFNIYVKRNRNGEFRLWCEHDDSYDCWHVRTAWGYHYVQRMMMHHKGKIRVCSMCSYENPEEAKFCMNCGAKLD